ncbi:MAG: peptidoglycan DD-metalloendopeptidase family protein [Oscillospiraceae bacterium]|nr:peptidoglycan DD-metalloendopeptidase family protein [Oscillospiraceae bacterium]
MKNRKKLISILAGIMAFVMILSLLLSLLPTHAHAASSSEIRNQINDLKEQKKDIQSQIEEVKSQYEENEDEIADMVARKNVIDQEIGLLNTQILVMNEEIAAYNLLIADKQNELDDASERLEALNAEHKERIRTMEEEGTVSYWEVLFKARSFADLLDRLNMVEEIAASDRRRLAAMEEAAEEVAVAQENLETEKAGLEEAQAELEQTHAELDAKRQEADDLITELLGKGEELEDLWAEFEAQEEAFMKEIAQKEKEYNEAKHKEWLEYMATYTTVPPATTQPPTTGSTNNSSGTNSGTNTGGNSGNTGNTGNTGNNNSGGNSGNSGNSGNTGSGAPSSGASWLRPCSYTYLSSPFGYRDAPTAGASTYHQGVDLAAPKNTPIYATRSGVVTASTYGSAAGYYVTINHGDGFSSIYMHMETKVVSAGQAVSAGQLIGYVGKSGVATGYHLHFGISYNGMYVNPCLYVNLS